MTMTIAVPVITVPAMPSLASSLPIAITMTIPPPLSAWTATPPPALITLIHAHPHSLRIPRCCILHRLLSIIPTQGGQIGIRIGGFSRKRQAQSASHGFLLRILHTLYLLALFGNFVLAVVLAPCVPE